MSGTIRNRGRISSKRNPRGKRSLILLNVTRAVRAQAQRHIPSFGSLIWKAVCKLGFSNVYSKGAKYRPIRLMNVEILFKSHIINYNNLLNTNNLLNNIDKTLIN